MLPEPLDSDTNPTPVLCFVKAAKPAQGFFAVILPGSQSACRFTLVMPGNRLLTPCRGREHVTMPVLFCSHMEIRKRLRYNIDIFTETDKGGFIK